ncbi:DedA family protein [Cypionkella sinensis]|uniref:DedA family protein n=1 Tax=Cypionkella sinensis TaxID=1756043 RepID=A0ABV7J2Y3_9RHOB
MNWIDIHISALIHHYGGIVLFVSLTLETLGLPFPGESALILSATLAGSGKISIWVVAISAWCGAVLGDNIAYVIGRKYGRTVVTQYGARFGVTESRYARVEAIFARFGPLMVIAARFVVLLRQMNGLVAGTAGMHWAAFALSNMVGAALWVGFWTTLAYQFGHSADVLPFIGRHIGLLASALMALALIGLLVGYWRKHAGPKP